MKSIISEYRRPPSCKRNRPQYLNCLLLNLAPTPDLSPQFASHGFLTEIRFGAITNLRLATISAGLRVREVLGLAAWRKGLFDANQACGGATDKAFLSVGLSVREKTTVNQEPIDCGYQLS